MIYCNDCRKEITGKRYRGVEYDLIHSGQNPQYHTRGVDICASCRKQNVEMEITQTRRAEANAIRKREKLVEELAEINAELEKLNTPFVTTGLLMA